MAQFESLEFKNIGAGSTRKDDNSDAEIGIMDGALE